MEDSNIITLSSSHLILPCFFQYFDSEFTDQSVALTPPTDKRLIAEIQEEEEEGEGPFIDFDSHRASYQT